MSLCSSHVAELVRGERQTEEDERSLIRSSLHSLHYTSHLSKEEVMLKSNSFFLNEKFNTVEMFSLGVKGVNERK